jgi:hypothetical protein
VKKTKTIKTKLKELFKGKLIRKNTNKQISNSQLGYNQIVECLCNEGRVHRGNYLKE